MTKPYDEFYRDKQFKDGLRRKCKLCELKIRKAWVEKNHNHLLDYSKLLYHRNTKFREKCKQYARDYTKNPDNRSKIRHRHRTLMHKYARDPKWRSIRNLRTRMHNVTKRNTKSECSMKLIGCSKEDFIKYIESKFHGEMSWSNYGLKGWHIDHVIPCDSFDLSVPEEQRKCFHYTNLQPLWWIDNIRKRNKI